MHPVTEQIMGEIQSRLEEAYKPILAEMADETRKRINIPVERSGGKVIRSKRGEPPRRDKGKLISTVTHGVISGNDIVSGSVNTNTNYDQRLNNEMNRPIFGDVLDRRTNDLIEATRRACESIEI